MNSEIVMYQTDDDLTKIGTTFDVDTVRFPTDKMVELFQSNRSVIGRHMKNIFKQ